MPVEPVATYRLQLTPGFGFDAARGVLDHLRRLGVSHVYLSPIAEAVPGSAHGYDVVDHTRVRDELGGAGGFERLLDAVAERGMAVLVDHVPNHQGVARPELNRRWWELLRDGPASAAARWFDVDWEAGDDRVILPLLDAPLAEALVADGALVVDGDELVVRGGRRLPLAAGTVSLPLAELVDRQHYRLQHWLEPARNVRRFFVVDDLVAIRVEDGDVAAIVDTLPARYAAHPGFGGVRVDHVDGLADPAAYLRGLRERIGPDALLYVEKILAPGEWLPPDWPVDGTTGYEFVRDVDHLLLAAGAEQPLTERWVDDAGCDRPFSAYQHDARLEVVAGALAAEVARLTRLAERVVDGSPTAVADEVRRLVTELPRYRTYLPDDPEAERLVGAISDGPVATAILRPATPAQIELRTLWQQLTGPVMAKGAEDRAFYRYLRLATLCEVGGDPGSFALDVDAFHAANLRRMAIAPRGLLAGSTHDTKRSEDVRARSAAMTWRVGETASQTADGAGGRPWLELSRAWVRELQGRTGVDAPTVSLAVQTVVATPGLDADRLAGYLAKAAREAARSTSWADPDADYEQRLAELAELVLDSDHVSSLGLQAVAPGFSLAVTVLRLTSPGVPDIYQGSEGFSYRLVDPDNRVLPDWAGLERFGRDERTVADLWSEDDPAIKTVLVRTLLDLRCRRARSFLPGGGYEPIDVGPGAVAFGRGDDVIVVVRRGLSEVDTRLAFPDGTWYDVLDPAAPTMSAEVAVASLVGTGSDLTLPVAVFERD